MIRAKAMNELRLEMGARLELRDKNTYKCLWVVDFPLLEYNEEANRYFAMHHPFTSPKIDEIENLDLADPMRSKKAIFLHAAMITLEAGCAFAKRYANEALRLAESESDLERKNELINIYQVCSRVPAEPAQTFHEACQVTWFIHLLVCFEEGESHAAFAPGRFDQYTYPHYENDIKKGKIKMTHEHRLLTSGLSEKLSELGLFTY
jgi:hypothetical protein